jgi:hypothetical protein
MPAFLNARAFSPQLLKFGSPIQKKSSNHLPALTKNWKLSYLRNPVNLAYNAL